MAVARVRLADLSCAEGIATPEYLAAVRATSGSLAATGALVLVMDASAVDAVDALLASASVLFAAPAADKLRYAAVSAAYGSLGYRALSGKQAYDYAPSSGVPAPDVLARTAPRAYASLSAAGRTVLGALTWGHQCQLSDGSAAAGEPPVDLCALCEPAPLPSHRQGASLLSMFRYDANSGAAAPHVDRGLLTLVASTDGGLQLRDPADTWLSLQLQRGEVAVLVGATLAAATGQQLRAATHRVVPQRTPRSSVVLRLRGAPQALLPRLSVAAFEKAFDEAHVSVNRDRGGAGGTRTSGAESAPAGDETSGESPGAPASKRRRSVPQPAPAPDVDDTEQISIKVKDMNSTEVHFKVRPGTKFEKIFDAYCTKKCLERKDVFFLFYGLRVQGSQTPAELQLEDGDHIDALLNQVGD